MRRDVSGTQHDRAELVIALRVALATLESTVTARAAHPVHGELDADLLKAFGCVLDDEAVQLFSETMRDLWQPALHGLGIVQA